MNVTPKGKIGRLGTALREEVNRRLGDGQKAAKVAAWLNSLPEVQAMLAAEFDGKPINAVNMTKWRQSGFKNWLWREEAQAAAVSRDWQKPGASALTDQMAGWVAVHYLLAVRQLTELDGGRGPSLKVLREFCRDIMALRRGELGEARLKLEQERLDLQVRRLLLEKMSASRHCARNEEHCAEAQEPGSATRSHIAIQNACEFDDDVDKSYVAAAHRAALRSSLTMPMEKMIRG